MIPRSLDQKELNVLIGNGIRLHRKKRNLTIENLAEVINLSSSYLGLIERGQRGLSVYTLYQALGAFSLTLEELLSARDVNCPSVTLVAEEGQQYSSSYDTLQSLIYNLTDEEMVFVIDIIKSLKQYNKVILPKETTENELEDEGL